MVVWKSSRKELEHPVSLRTARASPPAISPRRCSTAALPREGSTGPEAEVEEEDSAWSAAG